MKTCNWNFNVGIANAAKANAEIQQARDVSFWVFQAADVIRQYREYAEEMRQFGKGFDPVGTMGHHVPDIEAALKDILDEQP